MENFHIKLKENKNTKFDPFLDNNILICKSANKNLILLLSNGSLLSWGSNSITLGRRCVNYQIETYIPKYIKTALKIIEIASGIEHCIMISRSGLVFSWGTNSYGQVIINFALFA